MKHRLSLSSGNVHSYLNLWLTHAFIQPLGFTNSNSWPLSGLSTFAVAYAACHWYGRGAERCGARWALAEGIDTWHFSNRKIEMSTSNHGDCYMLVYIYIYIWVNYNDLTATSLEIIVSKVNHPQMAELFRLVKYYSLPRYMVIKIKLD